MFKQGATDIWDFAENGPQHPRESGIFKAMLKKQFGQVELGEWFEGIEARRRDPTVNMGTFEGIICFSERQGKVELICHPVGRYLANTLGAEQAEEHNGEIWTC